MPVDPNKQTRLETERDPILGRTIDGFRVEEVVGRGGMGTVYRATQLSLGRSVAVKVLQSGEEDSQFLERFHREADLLSRLAHPNVVTVFERGEVDGNPYLVMEYIDGTSLREVMRRGPLPPAEALVVVRSVLAALEHAHRIGIIHRDIKPENVLLAEGGVVKVADFGLSRLVAPDAATRLTRTHVVLGTYEYMAPEQRERAREADERSDLYAAGVVLYESIAGELPIGNFAPLSRKRPRECDRRIDAIVERSLEKDPAERYQEATEMADAVSAVLENVPVEEARTLPSISAVTARVGFDPLRFATRLDLLATFTTLIGFALFIASVVWFVATTYGEGFSRTFYVGHGHARVQIGSLAYAVPSVCFAMLAWFALETAAGLRRYRPGARQAQACLSLTAAATMVLLPYSIYSWWVLHNFRGRTYFDSRSHGLSAAAAVSSIEESAMLDPDAPLQGRPAPAIERPRTPWYRGLGRGCVGLAVGALWPLAFVYVQSRWPWRSEFIAAGFAALATFFVVAILPWIYRRSARGPIHAFASIVVAAALCLVAVGMVDNDVRESYSSRMGWNR